MEYNSPVFTLQKKRGVFSECCQSLKKISQVIIRNLSLQKNNHQLDVFIVCVVVCDVITEGCIHAL